MEELIAWIKSQLETNEVFAGMVGGSLLLSIGYALRGLPAQIWKGLSWWYLRYFTVKLSITNADLGPYLLVASWLNQIVGKRWNSVQLDFGQSTGGRSRHAVDLPVESGPLEDVRRMERALTLGYGSFGFWYEGVYVRVSRTKEKEQGGAGDRRKPEILTLRFFTRNRQFINEVFRASQEEKVPMVYKATGWGGWNQSQALSTRALDTVILPKPQRDEIVGDLEWFFENKALFRLAGIPCTRGHMYYGPPGTGKTTLARALATHFGKDLYLVPMSELTRDSALMELMENVKEGSFVVFEDIDTVDMTQRDLPSYDEDEDDVNETSAVVPLPKETSSKRSVTLGGLLQALDGVSASSDHVVIMTTNINPKQLDKALTRPGRLDIIEKIDLLDREHANQMAVTLFDDSYITALDVLKFPCAGAVVQHTLLEEHKHRDRIAKNEKRRRAEESTSEGLVSCGNGESND